jgi:hypothetical protein
LNDSLLAQKFNDSQNCPRCKLQIPKHFLWEILRKHKFSRTNDFSVKKHGHPRSLFFLKHFWYLGKVSWKTCFSKQKKIVDLGKIPRKTHFFPNNFFLRYCPEILQKNDIFVKFIEVFLHKIDPYLFNVFVIQCNILCLELIMMCNSLKQSKEC